MKLEGSLDAFSLPDIFALLSMTKKTGGLHLRRAGADGVVWFTTGSLTGGASDVRRQGLARRVVGTGGVSDDALAAAVQTTADDGDVGVVRSLLQAGAVDEGVLHDLVAEHIVDTVFDLLRWPDGDFSFTVDEPNPDDVGVSRGIDEVVTEARRRLDEWTSVAAVVPSPQSELSLTLALGEDPQLSRDEWALLAMVGGRRTAAELVALSGKGEYAVVSALAALVERGLLRVDDSDGVSAVARRHALLTQLETGAAPPSLTVVVTEPEPVVDDVETVLPGNGDATADDVAEADDDRSSGADEADEVDDAPEPVRPRPTAVPSQPRDLDAVTPQRPEPFLPQRQPEHPEDPVPAAVAAVGGGLATVAAASPASSIERDPSVNKSLLLRLIAGVRGL